MEGEVMGRVYIMVGIIILLAAAIACSIWLYFKTLKLKKELDHSLWNANRIQGKLNKSALDAKEKDRRIKELESAMDEMKRKEESSRKAVRPMEDRMGELMSQPICIKILSRIGEANIKTMASYPDLELSDNLQDQLVKAVDSVFEGFSSKIFNEYPRLTKGDILYCCLYLIGVDEKAAAALTGKAYQTVWTRSNKLREVFGLRGDMESVMREVLRTW